MKSFEISNLTSGAWMGIYQAETADEAILAMTKDAGYESLEDAAEVCGCTVAEYVADLAVQVVDDAA